MPLYFNGELLHVGVNNFKNDKGEEVAYCINTISSERGVITINSKKDFTSQIGILSTVCITLRPDTQHPKLYKVSLTDITPLGSEAPVKTIN